MFHLLTLTGELLNFYWLPTLIEDYQGTMEPAMTNVVEFPQLMGLTSGHRAVRQADRVSARTLLRVWRERAAFRRTLLKELLPGPDSVLEDAGWTREAAQIEARKPFWRG